MKKFTLNVATRLALLSSVFLSGHAMAQDNLIDYADVFELEYAAKPQVHPNEPYLLYERRSQDIQSDSTRTNLWQVNLDGSGHQPLLSGKDSYRMPRFSPDGKRLAYVSGVEGSNQLYVRWLDSGHTARVTNLEHSPRSISWSPDGKSLAFSMFTPIASSGLFKEMPKKPKGANWAGTATYIDSTYYRGDGRGYVADGFNHIYVVPAEGGTPRKVTQGDFHFGGPINWSKDGKTLIVDGDLNKDWELRSRLSEIYAINVKDGKVTNLTNRPGPDENPVLSPNGKKIAYLRYDDKKLASQNYHLFVMDSDGSDGVDLTPSLDRNIGNVQWAKNGKGLYFSYADHGQQQIGYVNLKGKFSETDIKLGGQSLGRPYTSGEYTLAPDGLVVYTGANPTRPADLFVQNRRGKATSLTQLNEDLFAHKEVSAVKSITVESSVDKTAIEAWYVLPPGFDASKKYPLILEIHGGPHAAYGPNFSMEVQLMAAKGYVVVWANPRGSTSYGEDFANTIHHNYPSEDYNDLMDVVDGVINKGFINKDQLFVTGGSGGGTLTAWIIGKTDRFKAAVVAKPVINWMSFSLTADMYAYASQYWMPGMPWEHSEHLWKHSPLSLVGNVTTPTMLLTGEQDYRTPMSETEQYYQALRLQKVESALVKIKKAGHGIAARPSNLIQKIGNIVAWFERYKS